MTSPFSAVTPDQEQTALESITKMMTGTQMLKDEPGVVYSLAQEQAHPADAGAIDQFMQGLDAEKQVRVAQAAGTKIILSPEQKTLLSGLNVDYSGVEYTQQNATQDTIAHYAQQGQKVKTNPDGSLALDASGNVQVEQPKQYKAKGIGRLFQTLHNDIIKPVSRDAVSPALHGMNDAWNVVDSYGGDLAHGFDQATKDMGVAGDVFNPVQAMHQIWDAANGKSVALAPKLGNLPNDFGSAVGASNDQLAQMQAAGYDPTNFFSILAYRAKGLAHNDLTPLEKQWDAAHPSTSLTVGQLEGGAANGQEAVRTALAFTENPKKYVSDIENTLPPDQAAAKIRYLSSPDFVALTRKVMATRSTVGNEAAHQLGIDPVKHATTFTLASAGIDLAAGFLIDPTILAGKIGQVAKLNQIGIDTLADANGAASNLARAAALQKATGLKGIAARIAQPYSNQLANGWQRGIDLAEQIKVANTAGDHATEAALTAKFNAELPTLAPLLPDFMGKNAIVDFDKATGKPILGTSPGIHSLEDAVLYLSSKAGLTRLMNGRAAIQSSLTPGALSNFGLRKFKGAVAGWMTHRSAQRSIDAYSEVISRVAADPAKYEKMFTEGDLLRTQPEANDAANAITEEAIAQTGEASATSGTLASAQRAASGSDEFSLTSQGMGKVAYNLRATGDVLGESRLGWASPTAVAARARLAAQRFTTLLPRNTLLDIEDAQTGDKIYKMAMTYMNRGDSRMLQAAFNAGSGGDRKLIVNGLIDQLSHAAGLSKTTTGQRLLDSVKTQVQAYSSVGDEVAVNGEKLALHPGQVRTTWLLPTFRDLKLASSKIGLWEATFGRPLTSEAADKLMVQWKMGALFKPSTVTRNQLEGWLRTALEGQFGAAMKSRALLTMPNKELWERGYALESKTQYERLLADGDLKGAREVARGNMLAGDVLGRSKPTQTLAQFAPFALAGKAYRSLYGRAMTEDDFKALETMGASELGEAMEGYGQQILQHELGMRNAARQSTEAAKAGFGPALFRTAMRRGLKKASSENIAEGEITNWVPKETDGDVGINRFVNALAQRVNPAPSITRAVLDRIENPKQFDINHIVSALDDPKLAHMMHRTAYGTLFWEDGSDVARRATSDAEVLLGKQEWAQKLVNDYSYLLTGQNGKYQDRLANEIRQTGKAPDASWIDKNVSGENRPHAVLAPEVMAMPNGGERGLINALQDVEGAGYQWMVERPLQRTTSSPVFWANYSKARTGLNSHVDMLVKDYGVSREAAEAAAKELAIKNAWVKTEQLIDDPGQKSQFDIVARNLFPFSRATQAMVRRWGSGLWQDPARARKMMLAYEGATQAGLVYTNTYGEPTFTYPGSGAMNMLLREVAKIPGLESLARFPVSASMTGGVLMSVPGADNPLRMSMGPMISIPMREIFKLFPSNREGLDKVDAAINGPIGVGETWTQLMPTAVRKIVTAMNTDQRNSALASSTIGAISNLGAAGLVPGVDASPSERDAFFKRVQQQTQNQLFLRAVFGLFSPAAPSSPSEGTPGSQADYAFHLQGIGQLSDEYKTILNDVHGDQARANAIFTALHPDSAVWYETGHSQANASKVALPSTADALNWMAKNAGFISKYNSVAAYFLPESTGNQPFDEQAYKAQLELGLRQRKTPSEFYGDVRVRNAESVFYPTVDAFNQRIAEAKKSGNDAIVRQLTDQKSQWEKDFKNQNPLFAAKIDSYPDARAQAAGQLADLKKMVADGSVPDGYGPLLSNLIAAYDGLVAFQQQHPGTTDQATAMKQQARDMFDSWVTSNVANTPLADLYSGVFRTLDTNLVNLSAPGGN